MDSRSSPESQPFEMFQVLYIWLFSVRSGCLYKRKLEKTLQYYKGTGTAEWPTSTSGNQSLWWHSKLFLSKVGKGGHLGARTSQSLTLLSHVRLYKDAGEGEGARTSNNQILHVHLVQMLQSRVQGLSISQSLSPVGWCQLCWGT